MIEECAIGEQRFRLHDWGPWRRVNWTNAITNRRHCKRCNLMQDELESYTDPKPKPAAVPEWAKLKLEEPSRD